MILLNKYSNKLDKIIDKSININYDKINDLPRPTIIYSNDEYYKQYILNKLLKNTYGANNIAISNIEYIISGYSNVKTKVNIKQSKNHIIIEPTSTGFDKYLIQEVVSEYVNSYSILNNKNRYKTIVINKIDDLNVSIQYILRKIIEMHNNTCKFILLSSQLSRIIVHIKSLCIQIRLPLITRIQLIKAVLNISNLEKIQLDLQSLFNIFNNNDNKLNKTLWLLEMYKYTNFESIDINIYENEIENISKKLIDVSKIKTPFKLNIMIKNIRESFYLMFITNVPIFNIIKLLMGSLIKKIKDPIHIYQLTDITSKYNIRINKGTRSIIQFEAYIMAILKFFNNM